MVDTTYRGQDVRVADDGTIFAKPQRTLGPGPRRRAPHAKKTSSDSSKDRMNPQHEPTPA
jgi:hypothetical protein